MQLASQCAQHNHLLFALKCLEEVKSIYLLFYFSESGCFRLLLVLAALVCGTIDMKLPSDLFHSEELIQLVRVSLLRKI